MLLGGGSFVCLTNPYFSPSLAPTAGLSLNFISPRNFGQWSVNNDILFTPFATEKSYEEIKNGRYNKYGYEIELLSLQLNHMVRYQHPTGRVRFFSSLGFVHGYSYVIKNNYNKFSEFGPNSYTETGKAFPYNEEISVGYMLGLGGYYDRFSVETRIKKTRGLRNAFDNNSLFILLGYRLKE